MRLTLCLVPVLLALLVFHTPAKAAPRPAEDKTVGACLRMTVAASDIASFGGQERQHYRIFFENLCDSVRVVYWCAEHPSKTLTVNSVCAQRTSNGPAAPATPATPVAQAGIAAPLYAVTRHREFQWTFPQGTRIRFIDCDDKTYPTSDFRCTALGQRTR